ncbi:polyprenol monophosphomannose synthase [Micromonospora sagamiensis]|uniref:Dolichol-phosphate mannosyltransferase n=1 Tax=Micromonospora sagamiensis TaxID=47875 RepID=A0A562WG30_9ACTN|nr:polyprenol monophosphomannose synthase [Micromonospora sagamiensis]TWJ29233.1 dolichol-phosphate mannosyltransferase [Micromonospora sagamiensis]BCL17742.1 dolichol-phosphate mannosyltransferase [Micromonospora sagamiensis]
MGEQTGRTVGRPDVGRVLVVVPTYNEADNLAGIVDRVHRHAPGVDVLVADDNSPDGTGALADGLARVDPRVHVLHREGKAGLGAAYLAGFAWARRRGYDAVVEMDADGSHAPEDLPTLLDAARDADVVIGSRWQRGARVLNWPWRRLLLSRGGNWYARWALGVPVSDATGGYRVYRLRALAAVDLDRVCSRGYSFQVELSRLLHRAGARMVEVPITFAERERGSSKMSPWIVLEALWRITLWGLQDRRRGRRRPVAGRWP